MSNDNNSNLDQILEWVLQNNMDNNQDYFKSSDDFVLNNDSVIMDLVNANNSSQEKKSIGNSNSEDDELTDAQLKLLPSKERRQIRNKISARNFRNRRKEYITSMENKIKQYEAENNQLKLEVKWVRDMMNKLQKENDQMRLELVLCKGGIQTSPTPYLPLNTTNDMHTQPNEEWDLLYQTDPIYTTQTVSQTQPDVLSTLLSISPTTTSPITPVNTTSPVTTISPIPTTSSTHSSPTSHNNIFISHLSLPDWDLTELSQKSQTKPSSDLIRTFPLLVPALMSIVIGHTLTLTPKQLISSQLDPDWITKMPYREEDKFVKSLPDLQTWTRQIESNGSDEKESSLNETLSQSLNEPLSPLHWLQKQLCQFLLNHVAVKYPNLKPCRLFMPICEKYRIKQQLHAILE